VEAINPLPTNPLENYTYDSVGNRTDSNQNGLSQFNVANELNEDGDFTYQYDNNGNMTRKTAKVSGAVTTYHYDAENKLVRVVSGGTTVNYKYDGLGRRVEKEVTGAATKITRYIYDNEDILLELDGSNNIVARYTHGPGVDEPLVMEKAGANSFYHADALGSITEITNQAGGVVQRYSYSSFGEIESQLDPNFVQPYAFTAREFDPEIGLYFYRARYYDPGTGRFLSEDPIRTLRSITLYAYVLNNPTGHVDPSGKVANIAIGMVIGGTIGGFRAALTGENLVAGVLTGAAIGGVAGATFGGSLLIGGAALTIGEASVVTGVSAFTITSISKALQGATTCRTLIDGLKAGIFTTATGFLGAQFARLAGDVAVGVAPGFSELVQRFFSTGFSVLGAEVGAAITLSEQFDQQRRQKSH
jgi:RHS repeat-associated protein